IWNQYNILEDIKRGPYSKKSPICHIQATTDAAIRNQGASIKTLEIQIGKMSKVLQERGFGSLPSSTEINPRDQVKSISTTIETDSHSIRHFIILDMPEDIKVPLILGRTFLSTARANIDVYKRKITLRVGEEKSIFKSVKPASSIIKRVYMLRDYIELNDLNVPIELRRDQVNDLMSTIEEGGVIEEFRARSDTRIINEIFRYPSDRDHEKKIHMDYAYNLKFSCMIGFEFIHANFFPVLYVIVMSRKFHNSIMKHKMEYKGNNVVGALMNVPIFIETFFVTTDFAVLEDMDDYRDEDMGDVIFGKLFLNEVGINARRFDGMITIYNGDEEATYQMVRSHPRFKCHTNVQCNMIPSLLKVSDEDMKNGVSHAYQKLKGFYKGVLKLGPDYIRNVKTEEWLTCGQISVHELEW
ncbi:homeodomain-like protein, partial [Tanacetum coccineum]